MICIDGDNDMLNKGDSEKLPGFFELFRYRNILIRRFYIPARMVVSDNDARSPVFYRLGKDFARMD